MSIDQVIGKLSSTCLTETGMDISGLLYGIPIGAVIIVLLVMIKSEIKDGREEYLKDGKPFSIRSIFDGDKIVNMLGATFIVSGLSLGFSLLIALVILGEGKEGFVKAYVKGLDTNKVELRELEKDSVEVRDVINKKNDKLYADVWVSEKDKKMGAFISHMKIVRDLESDDASYVTYKKITKSIKYNGNYGSVLDKKGWANAELHVPAGLKNYEIANHVKASVNGEVVE